TSGARQKDEEWNPEENGGFAIHENDPSKAGPSDPLAQLEKTSDALRKAKEIGAPRIESLQELSDTYNTDPYELSKRVRKQFREVKKVDKRKREEEEAVKDKYSLPSTLKLVEESEVKEEAKNLWAKERTEWEANERTKRRRTIAEVGKTTKKDGSLAASLLKNSLKSSDPFLSSKSSSSKPALAGIVRRPRG
ncbi:16971_t:CDS:2, partial [Acaulospora colombiana]